MKSYVLQATFLAFEHLEVQLSNVHLCPDENRRGVLGILLPSSTVRGGCMSNCVATKSLF